MKLPSLLFAICSLLFISATCIAGTAVNVEYVHLLIDHVHGIQVPINAPDIKQAVNVKYVLCAVDRANEILNGDPTTDYCNHPLAVQQIIDEIATIDAVTRLVKLDMYPGTGGVGEPFKVHLTGMNASDQFNFYIIAQGNFTVDWGDGTALETITKPNTGSTAYSHTYTTAGDYVVTIGGLATGYTINYPMAQAAITFTSSTNKTKITKISGDLGSVFPILNTSNTGSPAFSNTFRGLTGWTGSIPANLFAGLNGAPAANLFYCTFESCTGLTGTIPGNLFAGISGPPAANMFANTFSVCTGLTGIGDGLFDGISGVEQSSMFQSTFYGCTNLTGPSAKSNGQYLYDKWSGMTTTQVSGCYRNATKLSDYASIPTAWK